MTEEQLTALLRLKRYEQPPAAYFDRLLQEVHRRQRAELLRRPLWRIALERWQTFFGEHSMGHASYAGAMAAVLVVGVTTIGLLIPGVPSGASQLAKTNAPEGRASAALAAADRPNAAGLLSLQKPAPVSFLEPALDSANPSSQPTRLAPASSQLPPRYIIDARPVSFAPPGDL